jgi:hypothetical protein
MPDAPGPMTISLFDTARFLMLAALIASATARAESSQSTPAARDAIAASTGAILQGDARRAMDVLQAVAPEDFVDADADFRACLVDRFGRDAPAVQGDDVTDGFVRTVLALYQSYWWHSLMQPAQREGYEAELATRLSELLSKDSGSPPPMGGIDSALKQALAKRGHHALLGRTPPLRELMLWRKQTVREDVVALPEGEHRVSVELLDDFLSLGWSAYGRCGRATTGGWATTEAIHAVVPAYQDGLDGEAFRVVFLAHEAQHFADKQRWPGLAAWELEYRAKLTELAMAGENLARRRLAGFVQSQGDDLQSPHTYANKRVIDALQVRLGRPPMAAEMATLAAAALATLRDDTRQREAAARGG